MASIRLAARAVLFRAMISGSLLGVADAPKAPPWEQFDENGIAVFRREVPGSPIIALRGEGIALLFHVGARVA